MLMMVNLGDCRDTFDDAPSGIRQATWADVPSTDNVDACTLSTSFALQANPREPANAEEMQQQIRQRRREMVFGNYRKLYCEFHCRGNLN
jgi:hypothetical protein